MTLISIIKIWLTGVTFDLGFPEPDFGARHIVPALRYFAVNVFADEDLAAEEQFKRMFRRYSLNPTGPLVFSADSV